MREALWAVALVLLRVVTAGVADYAGAPAGFACRRAWQSASESRAGVARAYGFRLEQSIESKWLGASNRIGDPDLISA